MEIPQILEKAIENELSNIKLANLKFYGQNLSNKYMKENRTGKSLLSKEEEALAYSIMRMPATFCAVKSAIKYILQITDLEIKTCIDVGAGTGAATWAVSELLFPENLICLERERVMSNLGKKLMKNSPNLTNTIWKDIDICNDDFKENADFIVSSYMLNELLPENREKVIEKLWKSCNKVMLIVEPGTPAGFEIIKEVQKYALENNGYVIAPCTSQKICKLPKDDWCHSIVRVQRNKIHRYIKGGTLSYEDEKFSYIAIAKENYGLKSSRILRKPVIEKACVKLKVCVNGEIEEKIITKKDKELYKIVRKKECGDSLE